MAPSASTTSNTAPSSLIPLISPRVLHLFPCCSNIYKSTCFYFKDTANLTTGDFGAVLAFAAAHGHPVTVFECRNLQQFQLMNPLAIIHPLTKVPPQNLECGWFLLALAQTPASHTIPAPAPPAIVPPVPANNSTGSIANGSHVLSSLLMHASLGTSCRGDPPSVPLLLGPKGGLLPPIIVAPPCQPNPDGLVGPTVLMGKAHTVYGGGSLAVTFLVPIMVGHIVAPFMGGPSRRSLTVIASLYLLPQASVGGPLTSLVVSTLLSLQLSLVGAVHTLLLM
jgi:hypothetical protein